MRCVTELRYVITTAISFLFFRSSDDYFFSLKDLWLYLNERYRISRPVVSVVANHDNDLVMLAIGGRQIYWPSSMAHDDLSWLFGEVFAPWSSNPSSYDHPAMTLDNCAWVIDAGAGEGFFSLHALECGVPRVVAVEPLEPLWKALHTTFAAQREARIFTLFEGALGEVTGTAHLAIDLQHPCDTSVDNAGTGQPVSLATLDEIGELFALEAGGMVKMDIEGAEMNALRGATRLLRDKKPRLAVAVYHGYANAKLCADIIRSANPSYTIEFRGMYCWFAPPRPYMLFAW